MVKDNSYENLISKVSQYLPNFDKEKLERAYQLALSAHGDQVRKSGTPYISHPLAVAHIVADMKMDVDSLCAALLHDVVEDTDYTSQDISEMFGEQVSLLVDGVTKLDKIQFSTKEERDMENLRKMFLAMASDIRVIIIKFADRVHNMTTLISMSEEKQREKARETLSVFAPLAHRLGMYKIKWELEDMSLKYIDPIAYHEIVEGIKQKRQEREEYIATIKRDLKDKLTDLGIECTIDGRPKHFYSIYRKMFTQNKTLDQIYDLFAVRIITNSVSDCYAALGAAHELYKPMPGRFKDYIAMPKPNMYQSLHTTVIGDNGEPFEIQIRTKEMHRIAEYGIAAHWKYKEGNTSGQASNDDVKLAWLRQSLEWQKDLSDPKDFLETMKVDLFASQVFVFTPRGEVIELPAGSTPLDFAFKIHTAIGCKCVGAKVNGKMVTIDYTLKHGDIVEIVTSANAAGPSIDWLKIAKSSNARNKIRSWLKKENKSDTIEKGKDLLDKSIRKKGFDPALCAKQAYLIKAFKAMNFANEEEAFTQLANGGTLMSKFCNLLFSYYAEDNKTDIKSNEEVMEEIKAAEARKAKAEKQKRIKDKDRPGIIVKGADNLMIKLAKCCNPVPGDDIVGFITKGRGISVHRCDCSNITSLPEAEKARFIEVEWEDMKMGKSYNADIVIVGQDRKGILSVISKVCDDMDINIAGVNGKADKEGNLNLLITLEIASTQEMQKVLRNLRNIEGIEHVYRAKS